MNLDTSPNGFKPSLNQKCGKNALLGLYSDYSKYIRVGFVHSPYLFNGESKPYTEDKGMEAPLSFYALQELLIALFEPKVHCLFIWQIKNALTQL